MDARQQLGELIYEVGSGIKAHSLALKIYNSEDELEYTDEEMQIIMPVSYTHLTLPTT